MPRARPICAGISSSCCSSPTGISSATPITNWRRSGSGGPTTRVLHFVHRYPGLKVADLLDVLRITKQSLGRVLKQLLDEGYIVQRTGNNDRRQRLLYATAKGEALVGKLAGLQTDRITRARSRSAVLERMAPIRCANSSAQ